MSNLALLCSGHHRALHAGLLVIEGSAPDFRVSWISEVPRVGDCAPCELDARELSAQDRRPVIHGKETTPCEIDAEPTSCEPDVLESSAPMSIGGVAVSTPHDLATRRST